MFYGHCSLWCIETKVTISTLSCLLAVTCVSWTRPIPGAANIDRWSYTTCFILVVLNPGPECQCYHDTHFNCYSKIANTTKSHSRVRSFYYYYYFLLFKLDSNTWNYSVKMISFVSFFYCFYCYTKIHMVSRRQNTP